MTFGFLSDGLWVKDLVTPAGAAEEEKMRVRNVVVSLDLEEMSGCSVKERKRKVAG